MQKTILILLLLLANNLRAQQVGLTYGGGHIARHSPALNYGAPAYSYFVQGNYTHQTKGNKYWQSAYGLPQYGLGVNYINSTDSIIGKIISITPFIKFNIYKNKSQVYIQLATGPAYTTKKWTRTPLADTLNNYFGSHLNFNMLINLGIEKKISKKLYANTGFALCHTSNGGYKKPNYGANLLSIYGGLKYAIKPQEATQHKFINKTKYWGGTLRFDYSKAAAFNGNGPLLPVYVINAMVNRTYKKKYKLGVGINWEHSGKTKFIQIFNNVAYTKRSYQVFNTFVYNEFLLGKFSIPTQIDFFINRGQVHPTGLFAQRFGLLYYPYKHINLGIMLKSVVARADHMDAVLGFTF